MVLVVLVLGVAGGARVAWAVRAGQAQSVPDPPPTSALDPAPSSLPTTEAEILVHVTGQVGRPGVVRLRPGDRVLDALEAAGGATGDADLTVVNLARAVVDGEQVYVPLPGETPPAVAGAGVAGPRPGAAAAADGVVDLNSADASALDTLPGVGPVLSERIIAWRDEHGRFTSVDELGEVSGIGEKLLSQIRDRVRVAP